MNYTFLSCIDSKVEHPTKFYGRFELGPFAPGQGLTVANALRRALLSQLPGTAITLVEIQGASHEYETLPGIRESVLDILLNLKQIVLTSDFDVFTPQLGVLNVKGPGIIRARDLKLPFFVSSIDPDQYIATLTENGRLNMKFLVSCGKNHLTHTPSDTDFSDLVLLLKKAQPQFNYEQSVEQGQVSNQSMTAFSKKDQQNKQTLLISKNSPTGNQQLETINGQATKANETNSTFPTTFYQKWKNERYLTKQTSSQSSDSSTLLSSNWLKKSNVSSRVKSSTFSSQEKTSGHSLNIDSPVDNFNLINSNRSCKIGYFPVDAIFMPVTRVNYLIDSNTEQKLAKETILLEVWTNGSVHPRQAIHKAAKALIQLFLPLQQMRTSLFQLSQDENLKPFQNHVTKSTMKAIVAVNNRQKNQMKTSGLIDFQTNLLNGTQKTLNLTNASNVAIQNDIKNTTTKNIAQDLKNNNLAFKNVSKQKREIQYAQKILEFDIANLDLTSRPYSLLKQAEIHTISELISKSKQELLQIKNFGQRCLKDVENALGLMGLELCD